MVKTVINGLCMAAADSVPGVSGGTIALIMGFYDRMIESLHALLGRDKNARQKAVSYLIILGIGWAAGMGICVTLLSGLFEKQIYFMSSLFLGLTAASLPILIRSEAAVLKKSIKSLPFAALGAAAVISLMLLRSHAGSGTGVNYLQLAPLQYLFLFLAGAAAISAMVLPGISGSTVLLIAGVYIPTIQAVKELQHLNPNVLPGLFALGFGVLFGIGVSVRFIRMALVNHRGMMMHLILGLVAGSIPAIVMGPTTLSIPLPALSFADFNPIGFVLGFALPFGMRMLSAKTSGDKDAEVYLLFKKQDRKCGMMTVTEQERRQRNDGSQTIDPVQYHDDHCTGYSGSADGSALCGDYLALDHQRSGLGYGRYGRLRSFLSGHDRND